MKFMMIFILPILLFSQAELSCEGRGEYILHDSNSAGKGSGFSHREASRRGYNITLKSEGNKIFVTREGKRTLYQKDKNTSNKYYHSKDKAKYLVKKNNDNKELYMYDDKKMIQYTCDTGTYEDTPKKNVKYTQFSKFIKRDQVFAFNDLGVTVQLFDLEKKKENERYVMIHDIKNPEYALYLWCYKGKEDYLLGLKGEEKEFEFYMCDDPGGSVKIKINAEGFFFQPSYMTLEKEIKLPDGEYDIDIMPAGASNKFLKGVLK